MYSNLKFILALGLSENDSKEMHSSPAGEDPHKASKASIQEVAAERTVLAVVVARPGRQGDSCTQALA